MPATRARDEAPEQPRHRGRSIAAELHDVHQQRVVVGRHHAARSDRRLHLGVTRREHLELAHGADRRQPPRGGVLGDEPHLDRMPQRLDRVLRHRQRLARRDTELQLDEVDPAADQLGHPVLHLQPGVDLEERDRVVLADEELDGAGVLVADVAGDRECACVELRTHLVGDARRRRLLEHLLVAALDRALALVEVDDVAVRVAHDLHLDMATALDVRLDEHGAVAEGSGRLTARRLDRSASSASSRTTRMPRPPPPAAAFTSTGIDRPVGTEPRTTSTSVVVGTPAAIAARLAAILSPSRRIWSGVGPTHTSPASTTACAKSAFSARKP